MALTNAFEALATDAKLELARVLLASIDGKITLNEDNRIKVATMPGQYALQTGDISAVSGTVVCDAGNISNIMVHCKPNTSVAGHNSTFEGSLDSTDGTNGTWFAVQAVRSSANTIETTCGVLAAAPAYAWELSVNALKWFRIRCTAHTSGTMQWMIQPGSYATEPIPANQVAAISTVGVRNAGVWRADTTSNLGSNATFTGTGRAIGSSTAQYYGRVMVRVYSSHDGLLTIEKSQNSTTTNYRSTPSETNIIVPAGVTEFQFPIMSYYYRILYKNTGAATTTALEILSAEYII